MKSEVMLWNRDMTASVRASKIRSYGIYREQHLIKVCYKLLGWYNNTDFFHFGFFKTDDEARDFLHGIHERIGQK